MEDDGIIPKYSSKRKADMTEEEYLANKKWRKQYYEKNRVKIKERYDNMSKEDKKKYVETYRQRYHNMSDEQKTYYNDYQKKILATQKGRWKTWKLQNIRVPLGDQKTEKEIFERYENSENCELCNCVFETKRGSSKKCLDHHHSTGYPRFICCHSCNIKIGKVDRNRNNFSIELLRTHIEKLESYIEKNKL